MPQVLRTAEYLTHHVSVRGSDTVDQLRLRDSLFRKLTAIDEMVASFVEEKIAEGFSLDDISQLYALECSLVPVASRSVDGRALLEYEARIVERVDD